MSSPATFASLPDSQCSAVISLILLWLQGGFSEQEAELSLG